MNELRGDTRLHVSGGTPAQNPAGEAVDVALPASLYARLVDQAAKDGVSLPETVEWLLAYGLGAKSATPLNVKAIERSAPASYLDNLPTVDAYLYVFEARTRGKTTREAWTALNQEFGTAYNVDELVELEEIRQRIEAEDARSDVNQMDTTEG